MIPVLSLNGRFTDLISTVTVLIRSVNLESKFWRRGFFQKRNDGIIHVLKIIPQCKDL